MLAKGKIYARLINKYVVYGLETGYHSIADVPTKYKDATREAYRILFGVDAPEE